MRRSPIATLAKLAATLARPEMERSKPDEKPAPAPSAPMASSARPASPETGSDGSRVHG